MLEARNSGLAKKVCGLNYGFLYIEKPQSNDPSLLYVNFELN